MKNLFFKYSFLLAFLFLSLQTTFGQETPIEKQVERVKVITNQGNQFIGDILEQFPDSVILETQNLGEITILHKDIKSVKFLTPLEDETKEGNSNKKNKKGAPDKSLWFENPVPNSFTLSANALNIKKGTWLYQNGMLTYNGITYGVTNNFSIKTSGFVLWLNDPIFIINPKLSFPIAKEFSIGVGQASVLSGNGSGGFIYGMATLGRPNRNITFSLGYAHESNEGFLNAPIFSINGLYRFKQNLALIMEGWFFNDDDLYISELSVISYGIRFYSKSIAIDFTLVNNNEIAAVSAVGLPLLNAHFSFGKR